MRAVLMLVITWMILSPEIVTTAQAAPARANRVSVSYVPPKNPAHQPILDQLREVGFLEKFQKFLTPFRLPRALLVKVEGCDGDANAFYEITHWPTYSITQRSNNCRPRTGRT
jgi:hypothetical protein